MLGFHYLDSGPESSRIPGSRQIRFQARDFGKSISRLPEMHAKVLERHLKVFRFLGEYGDKGGYEGMSGWGYIGGGRCVDDYIFFR